jgi:bifunctional non-homologous end joining protein LigD
VRDDPISPAAIKSTNKAKTVAKSKSKNARVAKRLRQQMHSKTARSGRHSTENGTTEIAGVRLSHPDKVLYPKDGFTKLDLSNYYQQAAPWMLPHVENRLLALVRCPAGSGQKCFFQKHPGEGTSEHLRRFKVREQQKIEEYLALYDLEGLISLVQMGVLEIHLWGSQADEFEKPDRLIFDLDPDPAVRWPQVVTAAKEVRLLLDELGLTSFIKTTGGKGLHIVVPIRRSLDWQEAKTFCRLVAEFLVAAAPDRYIAKMSKAARKGKIFVDYLRNDRGATAIAPYSTRSRPGAPVSVPIAWEELDDGITSDFFNIANLPQRLARLKTDPWGAIGKTKQSVTAQMLRRLKLR